VDPNRFDGWATKVGECADRRHVVMWLGGSVVSGLVALTGFTSVGAKQHGHRRHKRHNRPVVNQHGCLDVGQPCRGESSVCCSGICQGTAPKKGKQDRSTCIAHNAGTCSPDQDACTTGVNAHCNAANERSICLLTTGNAGFCGDITAGVLELCRVCDRDTDCQAEFGVGAACVSFGNVCSALCPATSSTACVPAGV
jgi:hypothetical protein